MRCGTGIGGALSVALLLAPAARAADKEAIQRAVDRGVAYLQGVQGPDGTWRHTEIGATALCGLALLESGVKADDPAVRKAAKAVRDNSVTLTSTYSLSLAIMFLDRVGDPADDELIDSIGVRLLGGQNPISGGWSYGCPGLSDAEVRRLQGQLQQRPQPGARAAPAQGRPGPQDLPQEIQQELQLMAKSQAQQQVPPGGTLGTFELGDNSNTQFAILGLWIARRKGIPVENALRRVDARFRTTQQPDGGWSYTPPPPGVPPGVILMHYPPTPSMTCAGLLGLALSHGSAIETTLRAGPVGGAPAPSRGGAARDISSDPAVTKGLVALGKFIGKPLAQLGKPPNANLPGNMAPFGAGAPPAGAEGNGRAYYFLFSLERVAVVYGLGTIGDKDWYNWGADALLASQNPDGSWTGEYGAAGSDTCFALLFLRQANLAKDLTATLIGRVKDPGAELRAVDPSTLGKGGAPKETRPAEPAVSPEAAQLSDELVKSGPPQQAGVLRKLRDSKGAVYTDALAHAIRRLDGAAKGQARDALADRLTRMSAKTLTDKLQDDDLEIRRAAALACAMKDEKAHVPRLVEMLQDPEPEVARAAHAALKSLTNQDFGPGKDASRADVARAADAWKEWWGRNGDR